MTDKTEILWRMYQEHLTQGRHHETQRSTMTNLFVSICAASLGLFALGKDPMWVHLFLSLFLIALGIFGAVFSAKHYERFWMHIERARGYRDALERCIPETGLKSIKEAADKRAKEKYPKLYSLRLFWFWIFIHVLIVLIGLVLSIWSSAHVFA